MRRKMLAILAGALVMLSCIKIKHEMTIQPIHITVEVLVKIDRELDDFFADIDKAGSAEQTDVKKEEKK